MSISLDRVLEQTIREEMDAVPQDYSKFRLADAGWCPAMRILKCQGVPFIRQMGKKDLGALSQGHQYHRWLQDIFTKAGVVERVEGEVGDDHFLGHYDMQLRDDPSTIVEIKSMKESMFNKIRYLPRMQDDRVIRRYGKQLASYLHFVGVPTGRLYLV